MARGGQVTNLFPQRRHWSEGTSLRVDGSAVWANASPFVEPTPPPSIMSTRLFASAAVRPGHRARRGAAADKETPPGIRRRREGPEQTLFPEGEGGPLVHAVSLLHVRPKDAAAEHQPGQEELPGERTELAAGVVVGN